MRVQTHPTNQPTHHQPAFSYEVRRAFYWYDDGLAYNFTLKSLHRKLHNHWGQIKVPRSA